MLELQNPNLTLSIPTDAFQTTPTIKNNPNSNAMFIDYSESTSRSIPKKHQQSQPLISKTQKLLKEFKQTLKETDALTSHLTYESSGEITLPITQSLENEINPLTTNTARTIKELNTVSSELERLKISNDVLIKANIDLKNKNKVLNNEISQYKNSPIYKDPYSQYDQNMNKFIQDLKTSLENAQLSNQELIDTVNKTNTQCEKLSQANTELISNFENAKKEYESVIKENSELRALILNRNDTINELNKQIENKNDKITQIESSLLTNEKQINYLNTINTSNNQMQKDTEIVLVNLKATIENLQKSNTHHISIVNDVNKKFEEMNTVIHTKELEIEQFKKEIELKEKEHLDLLNKVDNLEKSISNTKSTITQHKNEIQQEIFEKEKLKTQIETMQVFLNDKDKTIQNLKHSMMFLTKTFDNDLTALNANNNDVPSSNELRNDDENDNNNNVESNNEIINDMIIKLQNEVTKLQESNTSLLKEKENLQNEINEYNHQFNDSKCQYQNLFEKFKEQITLIETLKKEFLEKRKENELTELIKANESIMNKLHKIQEENKQKTKELNELKINYNRVNAQLLENKKQIHTQNNYNFNHNLHLKNSKTIPYYNTTYNFGCEINELEDSLSSEPTNRIHNNLKCNQNIK
jgi:chromosome segregation ATPase